MSTNPNGDSQGTSHPAVIAAFVVGVVFFVKSRHRRTSERDPDEHASAPPLVASVKRMPVSEAKEPATENAYAPLELFSFQMSGRAQEADGSAFLPDEFVVFDLETTGLAAATDEIIEIGAIRVARNAESHLTFQSLVKPSREVSAGITRLTGISQGMLNAHGRPVSEVLPLFLEFVGDCPLVAYNASFDMTFVRHAARRCGLPFPNPYTCALQKSRKAWPELHGHKLADLARLHNLQTIDNHRALGDCGRTVHIFIQAVELLGEKVRWTTIPSRSSPLETGRNFTARCVATYRFGLSQPTRIFKRPTMTDFSREFPIEGLTPTILKENRWFTDLLLMWHPAGDALNGGLGDSEDAFVRNSVRKNGEFQHLRVAFRKNYMNFYCGGQSIANVSFGRDGLQAKIHEKYVYGSEGTGQKYVTLTSKGFPELSTGRLIPYGGLQEWISNANPHIGTEKRFVDLVVAHNPDVIDLEMGLPAYSKIPEERSAPRIDLVALEPCEGWWQVASWEAKLVGDGRARCSGDKLPEVVDQLKHYTDWLSDSMREESLANAYQNNCRLLVGLHAITRRIRPDIEELGSGIRAVAASDAPSLLVDKKPRLLVVYDKDDKSFRGNRHLDKLKRNDVPVQIVESLSEVALRGQS